MGGGEADGLLCPMVFGYVGKAFAVVDDLVCSLAMVAR